MVIIQNEVIDGIPVLHVMKDAIKNERRPLIIFVHGFESAKEHNLHYAYLLAVKDFHVVLPEVKYHGERELALKQSERMFNFWNIVIDTIHELNTIKNYYVTSGNADVNRIGLVGTSMGGIVTLGALTQYDWIKTAVSLMGSPSYLEFARNQIIQFKEAGVNIPFTDEELEEQFKALLPYNLETQPEKLNSRPLLFWHGKKDQMVPYQLTFDFYEKVKKQYQNEPERLHFLTDNLAGHKVSREGLLKTVEWFDKWL